jgi:cell division ATPase FtsA
VQRCGLQVDDLVLSSLASSVAVLTADERELGVVLVDIGAGTTDIAVFVQGAICHTASLPIAGDQVTNDIAHLLRTPTPEAEQIKVRYACALAQLATAEESIQVPSVGDRPPRRMPRHSLAQAVQGRYEEIFEMVQAELRRSGFEELVRAGMVLTGGASKMEGVVELAEEMLQMPVRVGIPQHVTGLGDVVGNPVHATGVGLLLMGSQIEHRGGRRCRPGAPEACSRNSRPGSAASSDAEPARGPGAAPQYPHRNAAPATHNPHSRNVAAAGRQDAGTHASQSGYNEDTDMAHFELIEKMAPNAVIKVVGVGGGGGNAVAHMVNSAWTAWSSSPPTPIAGHQELRRQAAAGRQRDQGPGRRRQPGSRPPGRAGRP